MGLAALSRGQGGIQLVLTITVITQWERGHDLQCQVTPFFVCVCVGGCWGLNSGPHDC
jgi:hypothetical protein